MKFNLIFFRSREAKGIQNKKLIQFSEEKVLEILNKIKPKYIVVEGFETFGKLKGLLNGTEDKLIKIDNRAILVLGKAGDGTPLIGMIHPSGAHGISESILKALGEKLKELIKV